MKLKATLMLAFLVIASLDALSGRFIDEHQRDKINNGEKRSPDPGLGKNNGRSQWPLKLKAAFDGGEKRSPDPRKGGKRRKGRPSWPLNKKAAFVGGQPESDSERH